jgi:hypothetical protein
MAALRTLPTQQELRKAFDYNARTGELRYRNWYRKRAGKTGCFADSRYGKRLVVPLLLPDGRRVQVLAHRVIWKWMTGDEPPQYIDHADLDQANNVWSNLRAADGSQSTSNRRSPKHKLNKSLPKGVYIGHGTPGRYMARITLRGQKMNLGTYATPEEAGRIYAEAAKRLHGEFARV